MPLAGVSAGQWRALSTRAAEPNGYYLPEWELAVNASARGRGDTDALGAWRDASSLIGLVPVISMWRAYKIPLPALVSADPYGTLCTPLLDRDMAAEAVTGILQQARRAGAQCHLKQLRQFLFGEGAVLVRVPGGHALPGAAQLA